MICVVACAPKGNNSPLPTSSSAPPNRTSQRLISLIPSLTETVCDLGLSSQLVAITANDDYPPEILNLPKVGDMNPDYEGLLGLNPNAILIDSSTTSPAVQKRLEQLGIPVITTHIEYLHDLVEQLPFLGETLKCPEQAEQLRTTIEAKIAETKKRASALPRHPRVYIDVYNTPLISAGKPSLLHELLTLAGGTNVYGDIDKAYPTVSAEELLTRQPDIVVLSSLTIEEAKHHPLLSKLEAVQNGRVVEVPASLLHRPTKRCLEGVTMMQDYFEKWAQETQTSGGKL